MKIKITLCCIMLLQPVWAKPLKKISPPAVPRQIWEANLDFAIGMPVSELMKGDPPGPAKSDLTIRRLVPANPTMNQFRKKMFQKDGTVLSPPEIALLFEWKSSKSGRWISVVCTNPLRNGDKDVFQHAYILQAPQFSTKRPVSPKATFDVSLRLMEEGQPVK